MAIYKLFKDPISNKEDSVIKTISRTGDGGHHYFSIPFDPENIDYQEFLQWKADGGVPDAAD